MNSAPAISTCIINSNPLDIQTSSFQWLMEKEKPLTEFILPKGPRFEIAANFSYYVMHFFVKLVHPNHLKGYMKGCITLLDKDDSIIDANESEGYFDEKSGILFKKMNWMLSHGQPYDIYKLLCEFAVTFDEYMEFNSKQELPAVPNSVALKESNTSNDIIKDFQAMFDNKRMTDVILKSGNEMFHAHKFILAARSPVFYSMFLQEFFESSNNVITISDLDSTTLQCLLQFMYGAIMEDISYENAKKLLTAANKYIIPSLKEICSNFLRGMVNEATVCELLLLSDIVKDRNLKVDAIAYIIYHRKIILNSPEWKQLQEDNNKLTSEVLRQIEMLPEIQS